MIAPALLVSGVLFSFWIFLGTFIGDTKVKPAVLPFPFALILAAAVARYLGF